MILIAILYSFLKFLFVRPQSYSRYYFRSIYVYPFCTLTIMWSYLLFCLFIKGFYINNFYINFRTLMNSTDFFFITVPTQALMRYQSFITLSSFTVWIDRRILYFDRDDVCNKQSGNGRAKLIAKISVPQTRNVSSPTFTRSNLIC